MLSATGAFAFPQDWDLLGDSRVMNAAVQVVPCSKASEVMAVTQITVEFLLLSHLDKVTASSCPNDVLILLFTTLAMLCCSLDTRFAFYCCIVFS